MIIECCCDENSSCVYHILSYLNSYQWDQYFNGYNNNKVLPSTFPLTLDQKTSIYSAFEQYSNVSPIFNKSSHQIVYRPQHNMQVIHPNLCCKCAHCLTENINIVRKIVQLHTSRNLPLLL